MQKLQGSAAALKVTTDYLANAGEEEREDMTDVRALALRLVAGGIRLGASLGVRAGETLARYARMLEGTQYAFRPTPSRSTHVRALPASGDTCGQASANEAKE